MTDRVKPSNENPRGWLCAAATAWYNRDPIPELKCVNCRVPRAISVDICPACGFFWPGLA